MRIFTFPYAFGTEIIFYDLADSLAGNMEVECMTYPGHGRRQSENLLSSIEELAQDAISAIQKTDDDYILLGYSMGAKVCCEILRQLEATTTKKPKHAFFLASSPPSEKVKISQTEELDIKEAGRILEELGTPQSAIKSKEFMEFVHPIVKADVTALETFNYPKWPYEKLDVPITIITGEKECFEEIKQAWIDFLPNNATYDFLTLKGGHMFLFEEEENIAAVKKVILSKMGI